MHMSLRPVLRLFLCKTSIWIVVLLRILNQSLGFFSIFSSFNFKTQAHWWVGQIKSAMKGWKWCNFLCYNLPVQFERFGNALIQKINLQKGDFSEWLLLHLTFLLHAYRVCWFIFCCVIAISLQTIDLRAYTVDIFCFSWHGSVHI